MAMRAWVFPYAAADDINDATKVRIAVEIIIFGGDYGDLSEARNELEINGLTPAIKATMNPIIGDRVKDWLDSHNVPFNPIVDFVTVF